MRYYVPIQGEPRLRRVWRRLTLRRVPAFPRTVMVETRSGCNARCVFCPHTTQHHLVPAGRMTDELYAKIVDECSRHKLARFSPFLVNEPLLDRSLEERLALAKQKLGPARITITTNASLLDEERAKRLIDTEALYRITVSFQSTDREIYGKTMPGLNFDKTFANVNHLIDYVARHPGHRPKLTVTMVHTSLSDSHVQDSLRYWQERGVEARVTELENRGGSVSEACGLAASGLHPFVECVRPFRQACITFDGLLVLCCVDYTRQVVLGDVNDESISDIWNGPRLRQIREDLSAGRADRLPLCAKCRIAGEQNAG